MFSLYKTFPGHFMTETSGERYFIFLFIEKFYFASTFRLDNSVSLWMDGRLFCFTNNKYELFLLSTCGESEFLLVDNLFR